MELKKRKSIGQILVGGGIITEAELKQALEKQKETGKRLGETLEIMGICTREDVEWALSHQFDIPMVRLNKKLVDQNAIAKVPASVARTYRLLPTLVAGDEITVVMSDPTDAHAINAVKSSTGMEVNVAVGMPSEIEKLINDFYGKPAEPDAGLRAAIVTGLFPAEKLVEVMADLSGGKLVAGLLEKAVETDLEAVLFEPVADRFTVRFKSPAGYAEVAELPPSWYRVAMWKLLDAIRFEDKERKAIRKGSLKVPVTNGDIHFDASYFTGSAGEFLCLRPAVAEAAEPEADIEARELSGLAGIIANRSGLLLFNRIANLAGIASDLISRAGAKERLLVGLREGEEPPLLRHPALVISDLPGNAELKKSFMQVAGFDPRIVFVRNLAGENPLAAGFDAAVRGRLLVTDFGNGSAVELISRAVEGSARPEDAAFAIAGAVSLKSLKLLCPACRRRIDPPKALLRLYGIRQDGDFFAPAGCPACNRSGYSGRRMLAEVFVTGESFRELLLAGRAKEAIESLRSPDHVELKDKAAALVRSGGASIFDL